jgi:PST family polysaccharide transporter
MGTRRTTALMLTSTALRMLLGLYTVKLTAVTLGVEGIGVIGQFSGLLLVATTLAGGGISAGIVSFASNPQATVPGLQARLASAHAYGLLFSAIVCVAVIGSRDALAERLLPIAHGADLLAVLALAQFGLFHVAALGAVANSRGQQELFAWSGVLSALVGACAVTVGCLWFGLPGTLIGIVIGALSQWLFLYVPARGTLAQLACLGRPRWSAQDIRYWGRFTSLSLVTVIGMPAAQIAIRNALVDTAGWEAAGAWQAMVRLSDAYLQFALVLLSAIYYPRLAAASTARERSRIVTGFARWLLPSALAAGVLLYLGRFWVVPALFSPEFAVVTALFLPQLAGDMLKLSSYLVTYALLSAGHHKLLMATELLQAALFWALVSSLGLAHGAQGVAWCHLGTYMIYLPIVCALHAWSQRRSHRDVHTSEARR